MMVNADVIWVDNNDEIRLYDPSSGEFQTLNASAAHVWRLLAAGADTEKVAGELIARFGCDDAAESAAISVDVRAFVAQLQEQGLVLNAPPGGELP